MRVVVPEFPAPSHAATVMMLVPVCKGTDADHDVVPEAVPVPPAESHQVTLVTPTLSTVVPLNVSGDDETVACGLMIEILGGVTSALVVAVATLVALDPELLYARTL